MTDFSCYGCGNRSGTVCCLLEIDIKFDHSCTGWNPPTSPDPQAMTEAVRRGVTLNTTTGHGL